MEKINEIVEKISYVKEKNYRGIVSYKLDVRLIQGIAFKISVQADDMQLISAIRLLCENPIKSYDLVKDTSADSGNVYYCVLVTLNDKDNTELKYFFSDYMKSKIVIENLLVYFNKYKADKKDNIIQEKINK